MPTAEHPEVAAGQQCALLPQRVGAGQHQRGNREEEGELGRRLARRPNSMPPMMVAPERLVPGISAKACATPTFSWRVERVHVVHRLHAHPRWSRRSAHRMIEAPRMKVVATVGALNRCAFSALPKASPSSASGSGKAIATLTSRRLASRRAGAGQPRRCGRRSHTTARMAADLDDDLEQLAALVVELQQRAGQDQVAGGGDRQEFGQPFHHAP